MSDLNYYYLCIVFVLQFVIGSMNGNYIGTQCIIGSNGKKGECISIHNCPKALTVFEKRPIPRLVIENIKKVQCGFDNFTPLVCCSNDLDLENLSGNPQNPHPSPWANIRPSRPTLPPSGRIEDDLFPDRSVCGRGILNDRIYGGQATDLEEFPWMALLGYRNRSGARVFECGGVLINKRYVLTAAHCVTGEITKVVGRLEVARLGEYDLHSNPDCDGSGRYDACAPAHQDIAVESVRPHKGFSDKNINRRDDIALIRLVSEVHFTDYVQPICLPNSNTPHLKTNGEVYVSGWGRTSAGRSSNVKLKLVLPVYEKDKCQSLFARLSLSLTSEQICAGGEMNKDACKGDSGGPLMMEEEPGVWVAVGVVSFGYGCGQNGWPGVYTSVVSYIDWIRDNMES